MEAVKREGAGWIAERASRMGDLVGSERMQTLAMQANRYAPELRTHDRFGNRIDAVEYHPAYHELMALAFGAGLHSLAWTDKREGVWVARAALNYLWNQGENGVACPVTMSFAAVRVLRHSATLAEEWEPKLLACDYDPRPLPLAQKRAVTIGMAMTERQGGSDLRANSSRAVPLGGGEYALSGHKWFWYGGRADLLFRAALACRRLPQSFFYPAFEGQVRQPLQRFVRNRVSRHARAYRWRGRARHRHADRDGAPHALRYRHRLRRDDAGGAQPGAAPCRASPGLRTAARRAAADAERACRSLPRDRGRDAAGVSPFASLRPCGR